MIKVLTHTRGLQHCFKASLITSEKKESLPIIQPDLKGEEISEGGGRGGGNFEKGGLLPPPCTLYITILSLATPMLMAPLPQGVGTGLGPTLSRWLLGFV